MRKIASLVHISLIFTFCLTKTNVHAQGKLVNGYIVAPGNDTIRGQIRDEGWETSPREVTFRKQGEQEDVAYYADALVGFGITDTREIYKSRKIGLLNITLDQVYKTAPSLEANDSLRLFLQEIVGGKLTLLQYIDQREQAHYFAEKEGKLVQLYNYPFYKEMNGRKFLLTYDVYKKQLEELTANTPGFTAELPAYEERYLRKYFESYNQSLNPEAKNYTSTNDGLTFDLDLNVGLEQWNEPPLRINGQLTYGAGVRINLPRRFRNRYLKANLFFTPRVLIPYGTFSEKITLVTYEIATGSYIGSGKIRPYIGLHYSHVVDNYRLTFVGTQFGISYKRRINLEVGHFGNFYSVFTARKFFGPPRISLHYMLDLSKLFGK